MKTYEAGHRESKADWPDPLQSTGFWRIGTLALPVTMLSICSAVVLGIVSGFFHLFGAEQDLFVLPAPGAFMVGASAAAISWLIVYRCRTRPGRVAPRLWALALASLNAAVAILGLLFPSSVPVLTLAVAGLSAALALLPRLMKVLPDSALIQRVAPLGMLLALIIVPSACALRSEIAQKTRGRVESRIQDLRGLAEEIREVTSHEWSRMEDSPDLARQNLLDLAALHVPSAKNDSGLWRSAAVLGRDSELFGAMEDAAAAVVHGFEPGVAPRISNLREPAIHWDPETDQWKRYPQFPDLSAITGSYHRELGRLFIELSPHALPAAGPGLLSYQKHYAGHREELKKHLEDLAVTWADNWAVFRVPDHRGLTGRSNMPLRDVLRAPFTSSSDGIMAPAQLWELMMLPLARVKMLAQGSPGCEAQPAELRSAERRRAAGCHCQNYVEGSEYFRLDCFSYGPSNSGDGANLRVEMRLVYRVSQDAKSQRWTRPVEIYFHFLPADGASDEAFRAEVMRDLAAATRELAPSGVRIMPNDRSGSVENGFTMLDGREPISVTSFIDDMPGLVPEQKTIVVRVYRPRDRAV